MGVPITAADLRINLAVQLDREPQNVPGVPGISNIPAGSQLVFDNGVVLLAQHPLFPCADTGRRIAEKYQKDADGKILKGGEFGMAALVEKVTKRFRRRYSRRGLATTVGSLGHEEGQTGPDHSSIHVGYSFTLKPPPDGRTLRKFKWYIPLKQKEGAEQE